MNLPPRLTTQRLILRCWRPADEPALTAMNRDPQVTEYLRPLDDRAIARYLQRLCEQWHRHGFGLYALELRAGDEAGAFAGFAGLSLPSYLPELAERPEIAWRLDRRFWGRGLATEAAGAVRDAGLAAYGAPPTLIAIIHPDNARSQRVAAKLAMRVTGQVHHPALQRLVDLWETASPAQPSRSSS
jgi:RimJ/RimL family protein N-acetyltransferase